MYHLKVLFLLAGSAIAGFTHRQIKLPQELEVGSIVQAIESISESTEKLGNTAIERPMNVIKGAVMQSQCDSVAHKIKKGIETAQQLKPLNMSSSLLVLVATDGLVATVNKTMNAVIGAHDVFASLPLVPGLPLVPHMDNIVLKNLRKQSKLSKEFGDQVLVKVSHVGKSTGKDRLDRIARSFEQAIAVYEKQLDVTQETAVEEEEVSEKIAVPFTG